VNLAILKQDLTVDARRLGTDLTRDIKAEWRHFKDPSQCGSIVRRHFNAFVLTLMAGVDVFMGAAMLAIRFFL